MSAARLAQRLLADAEACPDLIRRSETPPRLTKASRNEQFPPMALLSDPTLNTRQYLEDLVRIAVSSAERADDVSSQARTAGKKARRGMALVTCVGALGLMVGLAGFTASRSANFRLSEIRSEMRSGPKPPHW